MRSITARQQEVLDFIANFSDANCFPPTVREISEHFHISIRAVQDHIHALQKKGCLSASEKRSRSIRVLENGSPRGAHPFFVSVPILGNVRAGKPLLAEENLEGFLNLAEPFISAGKNYFALRIKGDSMKDAGILEGDVAIAEEKNTADNGQIVVAVLDDAITIKRFFKEKNRIRLQPENPAYSVIYTQEARIAGIVSCIVRSIL